eukprot:ANDGO_04304.mRNA.1 hypothetical protein
MSGKGGGNGKNVMFQRSPTVPSSLLRSSAIENADGSKVYLRARNSGYVNAAGTVRKDALVPLVRVDIFKDEVPKEIVIPFSENANSAVQTRSSSFSSSTAGLSTPMHNSRSSEGGTEIAFGASRSNSAGSSTIEYSSSFQSGDSDESSFEDFRNGNLRNEGSHTRNASSYSSGIQTSGSSVFEAAQHGGENAGQGARAEFTKGSGSGGSMRSPAATSYSQNADFRRHSAVEKPVSMTAEEEFLGDDAASQSTKSGDSPTNGRISSGSGSSDPHSQSQLNQRYLLKRTGTLDSLRGARGDRRVSFDEHSIESSSRDPDHAAGPHAQGHQGNFFTSASRFLSMDYPHPDGRTASNSTSDDIVEALDFDADGFPRDPSPTLGHSHTVYSLKVPDVDYGKRPSVSSGSLNPLVNRDGHQVLARSNYSGRTLRRASSVEKNDELTGTTDTMSSSESQSTRFHAPRRGSRRPSTASSAVSEDVYGEEVMSVGGDYYDNDNDDDHDDDHESAGSSVEEHDSESSNASSSRSFPSGGRVSGFKRTASRSKNSKSVKDKKEDDDLEKVIAKYVNRGEASFVVELLADPTVDAKEVPPEDRPFRRIDLSVLDITIRQKSSEGKKSFLKKLIPSYWSRVAQVDFHPGVQVFEDPRQDDVFFVELDKTVHFWFRASCAFERRVIAESIRTFNTLHCIATNQAVGDASSGSSFKPPGSALNDSAAPSRSQMVTAKGKFDRDPGIYGVHKFVNNDPPSLNDLTAWGVSGSNTIEGAYKDFLGSNSDAVVRSVRANLQTGDALFSNVWVFGLKKYPTSRKEECLVHGEDDVLKLMDFSNREHIGFLRVTRFLLVYGIYPINGMEKKRLGQSEESVQQLARQYTRRMFSTSFLRGDPSEKGKTAKSNGDGGGRDGADDDASAATAGKPNGGNANSFLRNFQDHRVPLGYGPAATVDKQNQIWERSMTEVFFPPSHPRLCVIVVYTLQRIFTKARRRIQSDDGDYDEEEWREGPLNRFVRFAVAFELSQEFDARIMRWTVRMANLYQVRALEELEAPNGGGPPSARRSSFDPFDIAGGGIPLLQHSSSSASLRSPMLRGTSELDLNLHGSQRSDSPSFGGNAAFQRGLSFSAGSGSPAIRSPGSLLSPAYSSASFRGSPAVDPFSSSFLRSESNPMDGSASAAGSATLVYMGTGGNEKSIQGLTPLSIEHKGVQVGESMQQFESDNLRVLRETMHSLGKQLEESQRHVFELEKRSEERLVQWKVTQKELDDVASRRAELEKETLNSHQSLTEYEIHLANQKETIRVTTMQLQDANSELESLRRLAAELKQQVQFLTKDRDEEKAARIMAQNYCKTLLGRYQNMMQDSFVSETANSIGALPAELSPTNQHGVETASDASLDSNITASSATLSSNATFGSKQPTSAVFHSPRRPAPIPPKF